jgi:SAM-dependent methyltransferase
MHHQRDREDFGLDPKQHKILEIGCNDASNLEFWFSQGYSVCGYEPCFHESMNEKMSKYIISTPFHCQAPLDYDYIYAYNVIAHIFHLQDFISDIAKSLKKQGILVIECPLFEELCRLGAWDTIYHEHFAYFTMRSLYKIFAKHGLYIFRMNPLKSHGGSIRAYFSKEKRTLEPTLRPDTDHLQAVFDRDRQQLPERMQAYKYPAFGAAAKGITLLNTLGIKADTIPYCIDETPEKQGKYMPMSKIPILGKEVFKNGQRYFNLAWNHQEEISKKYPEQIFIPIR